MTCTRIRCPGGKVGFVCHTSYSQAEEEWRRRYRAGERQVYCGVCGKWQFPDGCKHEGKLTTRQFNAMQRKLEKLSPKELQKQITAMLNPMKKARAK